jgi:hypothetical protein
MRASKLITLSAVAVIMGGTSFAIGQGALQSSGSMQGSGSASQGSVQQKFPGPQAGTQKRASLQSQNRRNIRPGAYARASAHELGEVGTGEGVRAMMRDIPRLSNIGSMQVRIDAIVPKKVQQAAMPLPPQGSRLHLWRPGRDRQPDDVTHRRALQGIRNNLPRRDQVRIAGPVALPSRSCGKGSVMR